MSAVESSNPAATGRLAPDSEGAAPRETAERRPQKAPTRRTRLGHFVLSIGKTLATLVILAMGALAAYVVWDDYVAAPWTRDGRLRVQVASIAPQVSGQITELMVTDNQYVHKGDVLYQIDPFDFRVSLDQAKQTLIMKAADLKVKKTENERRQHLSDLAVTPEEQQQYAGNADQAQAAYASAQAQVEQAQINLARTKIVSPVNGYVTNLLLRVGDYAHTGTTNISVIDADSYWIDGYFEETKLAHVCVGDRAEAQLMGFSKPIIGRVETVTRGISVSDATPSVQGLPNVDPVYTWVRLAQRVPVRIAIVEIPPGVPLVSGLTATVTIRDAEEREGRSGTLIPSLEVLRNRVFDVFHRPVPNPDCIPPIGRS